MDFVGGDCLSVLAFIPHVLLITLLPLLLLVVVGVLIYGLIRHSDPPVQFATSFAHSLQTPQICISLLSLSLTPNGS